MAGLLVLNPMLSYKESMSIPSSVQYIQTQNISQVNQQPLKDGEQVFVRVLKELGGGNYTVSFAGNRVDVQSQRILSPGESFKAVLRMVDGKLMIFPRQGEEAVSKNQSSIQEMLAMQGFSNDALSVSLIAFMQEMGLKIDKSIMQKASMLARRFPGKEKAAAEIASMLLEKGIEADEEMIRKLLMLVDSGFSEEGSGEGKNKNADQNPNQNSTENKKVLGQDEVQNPQEQNVNLEQKLNQEGKVLLEELFGKDQSLEILSRKGGFLTLVNHIKCSRHHWCFLPYEWNVAGKTYTGMIRLLCDTDTHETEKMEINAEIGLKKYHFVLYYNAGKVKEVRFCTLPPLLSHEILLEEKRLGEFLHSGMNQANSVPVTYSTSAFIDGLVASDQNLQFFDQQA